MSIDEAYLDLSALCQAEDQDAALLKSLPLAQKLKHRIRSERQLTATIGIASNKTDKAAGKAKTTPTTRISVFMLGDLIDVRLS